MLATGFNSGDRTAFGHLPLDKSFAASYNYQLIALSGGDNRILNIDYVIAWVNGNDPSHMEARRRFPPNDPLSMDSRVSGNARFTESGEIYYCIASVLKYAPFVRRIFIVTDNQTPEHLGGFFNERKCDPDFINIVSHDEIFNGLQAARPNFDSRSIESVLWRIPGLSEHFIYANDDFFLNSSVREDDFFREGKPVLHGEWSKPERKRIKNVIRGNVRRWLGLDLNGRPGFRKSLDRGAVVAGITNGFLSIGHHPHPLRKSVFQEFFHQNPDLLNRQVGYRYRNINQFNPVSLGNHLEILNNGVRFRKSMKVAYINSSRFSDFSDELDEIEGDKVKFGCIQSMEKMSDDKYELFHSVLRKKFKNYLPERVLNSSIVR